jgi:hypothetical protein
VLEVAGVLVIGAAVALWQAVDAFRWREFRRFWIAVAVIPPLCVGAGAAVWNGNRNPSFNFRGNLALGPNWECENLGRGSAVVCARGPAPPLSEKLPQSH